jgi:hypothetical protein
MPDCPMFLDHIALSGRVLSAASGNWEHKTALIAQVASKRRSYQIVFKMIYRDCRGLRIVTAQGTLQSKWKSSTILDANQVLLWLLWMASSTFYTTSLAAGTCCSTSVK